MKFLDHLGRPIYAEPRKRASFWRSIHPTLGAAIIFLAGIGLMGAATQINLATQVQGTLATGNGGTGVTDFTFSGSTHKAATASGTLTSGNLVKFDASGNVIDDGISLTSRSGNTAEAATVSGSLTSGNCLKSDASGNIVDAGGVCSTPPNFASAETPTGSINGSNTSFTLAHAPVSSSLALFKNGQMQIAGASADYTLSSLTVTYLTAPATGDTLIAFYRY